MASKLVVLDVFSSENKWVVFYEIHVAKYQKFEIFSVALWRDFFSKDVKFILVHAVYCKCDKIFTSLGNFPATKIELISCKMNSHKIPLKTIDSKLYNSPWIACQYVLRVITTNLPTTYSLAYM